MTTLNLILVLLLIVIVLAFLLRDKLIALMSLLLHLSFVILLALNLSAIFLPRIYINLVDAGFKRSGTYEKIVNLDDTIDLNALQSAPEDLFDEFVNLFSPQPDEAEDIETDSQSGYFEENVYWPLVATLANFYRTVIIVSTLVLLIVIVYLSYITSSTTTAVHLQAEVARLKEKVAKLESSN